MTQQRVEDLVDAALDAAIDESRAATRAKVLKAAAVGAAERLRAAFGLVDRFPSQQGLGNLRLDGADAKPVIRVTKPAELADFLAQRDPKLVKATVVIPADKLQEVLDALEFHDIKTLGAEVTPGPDAGRWVEANCYATPDPDAPGEWLVRAADSMGSDVPGLVAEKRQPRWVLTPDSGIKRQRSEEAEDEARAELEQATSAAELIAEPIAESAAVAELASDYSESTLLSLSKAQLVQRCKDLGILATGTKGAMAKRIDEHAAAKLTAGAR